MLSLAEVVPFGFPLAFVIAPLGLRPRDFNPESGVDSEVSILLDGLVDLVLPDSASVTLLL